MLKKTLYDKTARFDPSKHCRWQITEKLDGSNLTLYKWDGALYVGQRNRIFTLEEVLTSKVSIYKGLREWLEKNSEDLAEKLRDGAALCGEWIGQGTIKYPQEKVPNGFYMFAYAKIDMQDDGPHLRSISYRHEGFPYAFENGVLPEYISKVPLVELFMLPPVLASLDQLYDEYAYKVDRPVEGFVINMINPVSERQKYVRMKNGKPQDHWWRDSAGNQVTKVEDNNEG